MTENILWFKDISIKDVARVGGKNASLGEMYNQLQQTGVNVPNGFATTGDAFLRFLQHNQLEESIHNWLSAIDPNDIQALTQTGARIRDSIMQAELPADLVTDVNKAWQELAKVSGANKGFSVAVRSSATAEDLPEASFAGQQETFLNVCGIDEVLHAIRAVFASLYNDRAISYRVHQGFSHQQVVLSAGIQQMVRSDLAASGVLFSIDTESGFDEVVFITSAYGLGETVVQGAVNPDEFYVYKPNLLAKRPAILQRKLGSKAIKMIYGDKDSDKKVLTVNVDKTVQQQLSINDDEVTELAHCALVIEKHYGRPMDIEWAKDGVTGQLYIVQARPETVQSQVCEKSFERFALQEQGKIKAEGRSIGQRIAHGIARVVKDISEMDCVQPGEILVTDMTDPDWEPVMKRAAAIVTDRGGRTCHAAIIAREFKVPAVVGCGNATKTINTGDVLTVSCAEGDTGYVYEGKLAYQQKKIALDNIPELPVKVMINLGNPERAFSCAKIPNQGVGLARLEFIINNTIGIHPLALLGFAQLPPDLQEKIQQKTTCYASPTDFYVHKLTEGVATIAAAFYPKPVIVRLSDFKSNEYKNLLGGHLYEPDEENPMLGYRGAARYVSKTFVDAFALECTAIKKVRNDMGLTNVQVMVPFVRTVDQANNVSKALAEQGLSRGENALKIIMMCEIPANALLAEDFLQYFDGFSIGSNDLTQLTLGIDRDSGLVADYFDERDSAVKLLLQQAIKACKKQNKYVGICGQGPSDHPDLAAWLVEQGIDSLSLVPDTVLETLLHLQG